MPGIASGRNDGTVGTQFATARPCSPERARFAASSAGSFISQRPIASKPAAAYASTSSANDAFTVEICESDSFTSVLEALQAVAAASAGRVSSFATR